MDKKFLVLSLVLLFSASIIPGTVFGAQNPPVKILLDPAAISGISQENQIVKVKIKTGGQCINAAKIDIRFPHNEISLVDFATGKSILTVWIKNPGQDEIKAADKSGFFSFEGGIPGGFCDSQAGALNGNIILGELIFKNKAGTAENQNGNINRIAVLGTSEIYLNDGLGTKAEIELSETLISATSNPQATDQWLESLKDDTVAPENFEIKINKDDLFENGKYFITFSASDKQTGIDHYEISESPIKTKSIPDKWKVAASPYVLEDQKLTSKIKVKAVDKAGNETISEYLPEQTKEAVYQNQFFTIVLVIIAICLTAYLVYRKKHLKKTPKNKLSGRRPA